MKNQLFGGYILMRTIINSTQVVFEMGLFVVVGLNLTHKKSGVWYTTLVVL